MVDPPDKSTRPLESGLIGRQPGRRARAPLDRFHVETMVAPLGFTLGAAGGGGPPVPCSQAWRPFAAKHQSRPPALPHPLPRGPPPPPPPARAPRAPSQGFP